MKLSLAFLFALVVPQDRDAKKSAREIHTEAQRFESFGRKQAGAAERMERTIAKLRAARDEASALPYQDRAREAAAQARSALETAARKYRAAADRARTEGDKTLSARSLHGLARTLEAMAPPRVDEALKAYKSIEDDFADQKELAALAARKRKANGVDIYLRGYETALARWRDLGRGDNDALEKSKEEVRSRIQAGGEAAVPGLLDALGHPDELVRALVADLLAKVSDSSHVAQIVEKLRSADSVVRGGAALALARIFFFWGEARALEAQADRIVEDFKLTNLGAADVDDVSKAIENAEAARADAQAVKETAQKALEAAAKGDPDTVRVLETRIRAATLRVQEAESRVAMLRSLEKGQAQAGALRAQAATVRGRLPKELGRAEVEKALARLIRDEDAPPTSRLEAAQAVLAIGAISGELTDALLSGLNSRDRNVRIGCVRAAAAVDPSKGEDKHRLADVLIRLVQYVPGRDWKEVSPSPAEREAIDRLISKLGAPKDADADAAVSALVELGDKVEEQVRRAAFRAAGDKSRKRFEKILSRLERGRWANDVLVRQEAARALQGIGLVKSIPALIRALEDPDSGVRRAANAALISLTGRDEGFTANPDLRRDGTTGKAKEVDDRAQAIERWKTWWKDFRGVPVVVDRFWVFQAAWKSYDPVDLFDAEYLQARIRRASSPSTLPFNLRRAADAQEAFQRGKSILVMDAVDLGEGALEAWLRKLDGKHEEREALFQNVAERDRLVGKSRKTVQLFIADVLAQYAKKHGGEGAMAERLRALLGSDQATGAAYALGLLSRDSVPDSARTGLVEALKSENDRRKEAAALALMRVGEASSADALADVASAAAQEADAESPRAAAAVAALRALAVLRPKTANVRRALGALVGDEGGSSDLSKRAAAPLVREYACAALAHIADSSSALALARARRDTILSVRRAAGLAIQAACRRDPKLGTALAEILAKSKTPEDRVGAALALGDTGDPSRLSPLIRVLTDAAPPRDLRDPDPAVRVAAGRALGSIGAVDRPENRTRRAIEALLSAMGDPASEVRQQAYDALKRTAIGASVPPEVILEVRELQGQNPAKNEFKGWYSEADRGRFLKRWREWYRRNQSRFR